MPWQTNCMQENLCLRFLRRFPRKIQYCVQVASDLFLVNPSPEMKAQQRRILFIQLNSDIIIISNAISIQIFPYFLS